MIILLLFIWSFNEPTIDRDALCSSEAFAWRKDRKLQWSDFVGTNPEQNIDKHQDAAHNYYIHMHSVYKTANVPQYTIINFFLPQQAWVIRQSTELLEHEQLHFDITELVSRKLRYSLDSLTNLNESKNDLYTGIIDKFQNQLIVDHANLDRGTVHGTRYKSQQRWRIHIDKELSKTDSLYRAY